MKQIFFLHTTEADHTLASIMVRQLALFCPIELVLTGAYQ